MQPRTMAARKAGFPVIMEVTRLGLVEKQPAHGHFEEPEAAKNLPAGDSQEKQVLGCAQHDRLE